MSYRFFNRNDPALNASVEKIKHEGLARGCERDGDLDGAIEHHLSAISYIQDGTYILHGEMFRIEQGNAPAEFYDALNGVNPAYVPSFE